ncbi:hypothetical protein [Rhizobium yanglingense]
MPSWSTRHDNASQETTDRKRVFKEPGIREDDLAAIQPEERDASEKQIGEAIKRELSGIDSRDGTESTASGSQAADTQAANRPPKFAK